jgi:uncharacterized membrane protein YsdA (DUF1294 family)
MIPTLLIYLVIINAINFFSMGYDKQQARKGRRRIPERRLFTYAAIGGALGGWLGMLNWRHKTKHMSFVWGFPALFVINLMGIYLVFYWDSAIR